MKRFLGILALILTLTALIIGLGATRPEYRIAEGNRANFSQLLSDLLSAYESQTAEARDAIVFDLNTIRAVSRQDYAVAKRIADHWEKVYLDPEYRLNLYHNDEGNSKTVIPGVKNTRSHAFVILGYELQDGEMTKELKGRCDAAASAARAYPNTVLVCSGGATGENNPQQHTEAGMMKEYLVSVCGIEASRIFTDEKAMTTAENAVNTFEILREQGIRSLTIITSTYHQRWGQVLYNALAAVYGQKYGYSPVIISNYNFEAEPENGMYLNDARIAIHQLGTVLDLPRQAVKRQR